MAFEQTDETRHLTIEECQFLADSLSDDAATLTAGPKKEGLLKLAAGYRNLAKMMALVARSAH
ncbi:MAG TPA: hypothetical protein VIJ53_08615 [Acidobacteriaceae bacterium]